MARTPTLSLDTLLCQKLGTEPIMVIRIDWSTGSQYYADRALTIGSIDVLGKIRTVNNLSLVKYQNSYGAIGGLSVTLDDADKHFYDLMNQIILEGVVVQIYHYYPNLSETDLFGLFLGKISTPINWSESERLISFDIINSFDDNNVGDELPDPDDWITPNSISPIREEMEGIFPPIVFGNCVLVPCPRLHEAGETQTTQPIHFQDDLHERGHVSIQMKSTSVTVQDASKFSSGSIDVMIDNVKFAGGFSLSDPNKFIFSAYNKETDLDGANCYRDTEDEDYENYSVVWIETDVRLKDQWVLFYGGTDGYFANYCIDQIGEKCLFKEPFTRSVPNYSDEDIGPFALLVGSGTTALECAPKYCNDWPEWSSGIWQTEVWDIPVGATFIEVTEPIYIVNRIPGTTIKSVYAYRDIVDYYFDPATGAYTTKTTSKKLCKVPSSYYTKNSSMNVNGIAMTTITLDRPLSEYVGEGWQDDIYVTMSSPIGPNTADIIEWIIETFTTLTIDEASFAAVKAKIADYPSSFALFNQTKALQLCQQIAWQARCGLTIYNNIVYLKYLSEDPSAVETWDTALIQFKSMNVHFTDSDEIYTKITAKFRQDYLNKERVLVYKNNTAQYGIRETEWDFFIYNTAAYVRKSLVFWGNRCSNSWKKLKFTSFLKGLKLELFDCLTLSFPTTSPLGIASVKCLVEEWSYDSDSKLINMDVCTPIKAGTVVADPDFWLDDEDDGLVSYDPTAYEEEEDFSIQTASNKLTDPNQLGAIVTNVYPESVDDVETGKTLYDVDVYKYGFENKIETEQIIGARSLDPDTKYSVGDKVEFTQHLNKAYINRLVETGLPKFKVVSESNDYLVCHTWIESIQEEGSEAINIAKPYLLRRTPFDGETRNGVSYTYTGASTRTAIKTGEDNITEKITPSYVEGDVIKACKPVGGSGVLVGDEDIEWEEVEGGRLWCEEDTEA